MDKSEGKYLAKMERWMENLPPQATARPITQLAIPGSHDSGTVNLDPSLGIMNASCPLKLVSCCAKPIIRNWAKTQDLSITEQLQAGIRYLDLRVACRPGTNELRIVHTLYGRLVSEELEDVNIFLNKNPKEVVILDFNHFYNMKTEETHNELLDSLKEIFEDKCTPQPSENMWTLDGLWNTHHRVISLYIEEDGYRIPPAHRGTTVWPYKYTTDPHTNRIESPWPNTDSLETLKVFLKERDDKNVYNINQFYVWQGLLTPVTKTIVCHICSTLKSVLSLPATEWFVTWLKGKQKITICIVDFVENNGFIQEVVSKNNVEQ